MMCKLKPMLGALLALLSVTTSNPTAARWLSVDPVQANPNTGADFNRYGYANNNPYRFTDPDGRQSVERAIDRDVKDYASGNISNAEYNDRAEARGAGAVGAAAMVVGTVGAVQAGVIPATAAAATKVGALAESASTSVGIAAAGAQNVATNAVVRAGAAIASAVERVATQATQAIATTNASLAANPQVVAAAADAVQASLPGPPPMTPAGVATAIVRGIQEEVEN